MKGRQGRSPAMVPSPLLLDDHRSEPTQLVGTSIACDGAKSGY